jgi:hypothetical protein
MTVRIPHNARNTRRLGALFDGHRARAYALPADLDAARRAVLRLGEEVQKIEHPNVGDAERRHIDGLVAAAAAGEELPDVAAVVAVDQAAAAAGRQVRLLGQAIEAADAHLGGVVEDLAEHILTECLHPAAVDVMAQVSKAAKVLPDDPSPETLLRASDAARAAWFSLGDLGARYGLIRNAAGALHRANASQSQHDTDGRYAEIRNYDEVTGGAPVMPGGERPWPVDLAQRLLWFARHGADVWVPTVAQRDARFAEVHPDIVARKRSAWEQLQHAA